MRRWAVVVALTSVALLPSVAAQQATFRSDTALVVRTVSVVDSTGRPIEGLTAADFIVQEDGPNRWALSLGVFRTEEAAQARLATLRELGVRTAQVGARETTVPKVWLQVKGVDAPLEAKLRDVAREIEGSDVRPCSS